MPDTRACNKLEAKEPLSVSDMDGDIARVACLKSAV